MKTFCPLIYNKKGFTLLEVMIALAFIGIALSALLASQSQGLRLANEAKFTTTASFLAQKKMAEIELLDINDLMPDSGNFGDLFPEYYWEMKVNNESLPILEEYSDRFKQITLYVYWGENQRYQYELRLYKFVS